MDAVYSQAFDHLRSNQSSPHVTHRDEEVTDTLHQRRSGGRAAFKKRGPSSHLERDDMGQTQGTAEYIDPSEVPPRRLSNPNQRTKGSKWTGTKRSESSGAVLENWTPAGGLRGHHNEESDDYCYAYSGPVDRRELDRQFSQPEARHRSADSGVAFKDDYSQPPDRLSLASRGKVGAAGSQDEYNYAEPYQAQSESQGASEEDGTIYAFAKDVDDPEESEPTVEGHDLYHHTGNSHWGPSSEVRDTSDTYDHFSTWKAKGGERTQDNWKSGPQSPTRAGSKPHDQEVFPRGGPVSGMQGPSNYEEPWDSEEGQKRLSQLMHKAEIKDTKRQSLDKGEKNAPVPAVRMSRVANKGPSPSSPTVQEGPVNYEAAWQGPAGQRKFSDVFDRAEKSPSRTPSAVSPVRKNIPPSYEDAWDTSDKQKQLEEKIILAHQQRTSQGQIDPLQGPTSPRGVRAPEEPCPVFTPPPVTSPVDMRSPVSEDDRVTRSGSCRSLGALAETIDTSIPLEDQVFYHGAIKRAEAERMLVVFKEGSYLVRRSETCRTDFSLTLKGWNGTPMHMKITRRPDALYVLGENSQPFKTIPDMIDFYTQHQLPVYNAEKICLLEVIMIPYANSLDPEEMPIISVSSGS